MDLFTYLMAKNGHNTSIHEDLFSYLLGKAQGGGGEIKTATGITINIPDAKKLVSFMMTKESTQDTSILPNGYTQVDYIKSSKTQYLLLNYDAKATSSYELSLKFDNINNDWANSKYAFISGRDYETTNSQYFQINFGSNATSETQTLFVWINSGQASSAAKKNVGNVIENKNNLIINNGQMNYGSFSSTTPKATGVNSQNGFLLFAGKLSDSGNTPNIFNAYDMYVYDFKIYENNVLVKHYIPCYRNSDNEVGLYEIIDGEFFINQGTGAFTYGSVAQLPNPNYPQEVKTVKGSVDVYVSNGETTNTYTIDLGNNELVGIGDYKDELLVDKSGHVFINKKTGKVVYDGSETEWYKQGSTSLDKYAINFLNSNGTKISNYFTYTTTINQIGKFWFANNVLVFGFGELNTTTLESWETWLSTHNTEVYYPLETPEIIDLQTTVDLSLFKGVNNISNSKDGYMTIQYMSENKEA